MSRSVTIRISRNQGVARDRSIAVLKLNKLTHYVGQPVMVKYYSKPGEIDTLLALGIKDGIGADCYKIVSFAGLELVRGVVSNPPDISFLIHGEMYLYRNNNGIWHFVYAVDGERIIEPIPLDLAPTTFVNIEDNFRWFWNKGELKREDDFSSGEEMEAIINELFLILSPIKFEVSSKVGYLFDYERMLDVPLYVRITDNSGSDITNKYSFTINGEPVDYNDHEIVIKGANRFMTEYLIEARVVARNGKTFKFGTIIFINFGFNFYYGIVDENWVLSKNNLTSLENKVLNYRKTVHFNSIDLNYKKLVFSYPEQYGELMHIFDEHGLDYLDDYSLNKITISGVVYNVYIKTDAITIENFDQKYLFVDSEDEEIVQNTVDVEKYDEVIKAWERKNTENGLVQLNEIGKIPKSFIEGLSTTSDYSFVSLIGFIKEYPTSNMIKGDKWYNTEEKKIFEAISVNRGKVYDPADYTVYLNNTNKSMYVWKSENMELLNEAVRTESISNVTDILD